MLSKAQIEHVEKTLGYTFRDKSLLVQAFVRSSYCNEHKSAHQSNEVLELFGDSVLSAVLVSIFIRDFAKRDAFGIHTSYNEGELSTIKSNLSDKKNLSRSMRELGLSSYLLMGNGDKTEDVGAQASVMEDLYESLMGAVYIDCDKDMQTMIRVVERTLDTSVYLERRAPQKSYKNLLQEFCDAPKRHLPHPEYRQLQKIGPENAPQFLCVCIVGGRTLGQGWGKNKPEAEKTAAKEAFELLLREEENGARSLENTASPSHETPAARLHEYVRQHPELGALLDLDARHHPAYTAQTPRFIYTYRLGEKITEGEGRSKDEAKHDAARILLQKLGIK